MVAAAVIIHLVTDGTYYGDQKQETISVQLLDTKEQSHDLGKHVLLGLVHHWYLLPCVVALPLLKRTSSLPFSFSCLFSTWSSSCRNQHVVVYSEKPRFGIYEGTDSVAKVAKVDLHQLLLLHTFKLRNLQRTLGRPFPPIMSTSEIYCKALGDHTTLSNTAL